MSFDPRDKRNTLTPYDDEYVWNTYPSDELPELEDADDAYEYDPDSPHPCDGPYYVGS